MNEQQQIKVNKQAQMLEYLTTPNKKVFSLLTEMKTLDDIVAERTLLILENESKLLTEKKD